MDELADEMLDRGILQVTSNCAKQENTCEQLRKIAAQLLNIQEDERRRIATVLHDGIGQSLSVIKLGIENVLHELSADSIDQIRDMLQTLRGQTRQSIDEVRQVSMDFHPSTLDDFGIVSTLKWFIREFQAEYPDIKIFQHLNLAEGEIPLALKTGIYRIVQESLTTIAQSTPAVTICLHLGISQGIIKLAITHHGTSRALEPSRAHPNSAQGASAISLRDRAMILGADYQIDTQPGYGVAMRVSWLAA